MNRILYSISLHYNNSILILNKPPFPLLVEEFVVLYYPLVNKDTIEMSVFKDDTPIQLVFFNDTPSFGVVGTGVRLAILVDFDTGPRKLDLFDIPCPV